MVKFGLSSSAVGATLLNASLTFAAAPPPPAPPQTPPLGSSDQQIVGENLTRNAADGLQALAASISDFVQGGIVTTGGARRFALFGQGQTGAAGAAGGKAWNAWVAFAQNKVGYSFQPLQTSGTINVGMVGIDYTLPSRTIVGVAVTGDNSDIALNFNGGAMSGKGWTVSPYIGMPLTRNWVLDATVGFGNTKIDVNARGISGSFRSDRSMGSIGLSYRQAMGNWTVSGRGAYLAVSDKLGAYTLSNGTFVQGGSVDIQQLRFGGQAAYNAGAVSPFVGLTYVYDVRRPTQQPVAGQTAANDRDAWTPVIGLRFSSRGSLYGGIQYSSEQSRSQVKNNQLLFNLGIRF